MSNKPDPLQFGSIDEFRKAAKASNEPVIEARVRASFDTEVKAADDSRTLSVHHQFEVGRPHGRHDRAVWLGSERLPAQPSSVVGA
jgi:hypothetical protein